MAQTHKVSERVRKFLRTCIIEGDNLRFPPGQLDRAFYMEVDKTLSLLGAKWNRKLKAHVFAVDPTMLLAQMDQIASVVNQQQKFQFFQTPESLAQTMVGELGDITGKTLLEPSAGAGRLVDAVLNSNQKPSLIDMIELNPDMAPILTDLALSRSTDPIIRFRQGDFLIMGSDRLYDTIIMNPPFANRQAIKHILCAWNWLVPGGTLVGICDDSAINGSFKEQKSFQKFLEQHEAIQIRLPRGTFHESGTDVGAYMLVLRKFKP